MSDCLNVKCSLLKYSLLKYPAAIESGYFTICNVHAVEYVWTGIYRDIPVITQSRWNIIIMRKHYTSLEVDVS